MASNPVLSILSFFTLVLLARARLNLHRSDHDALSTIQKDFGINPQRNALDGPCNYAGVSCHRRNSNNSYFLRVTRIVVKSQHLRGFLSPAIGELSELRELSLPNNQLVDLIPPQMSGCLKLEILNLRNNRFSGGVPSELSSLIRLRFLDLSSNQFTGNLNFLTYFPNLEKLSIADNKFTGKLPASLRSFSSEIRFLERTVPKITVPKRYSFVENSAIATSESKAPQKHNKINVQKLRGWILGFLTGSLAAVVSLLVLSALLYTIKRGRKGLGLTIYDKRWRSEELDFLQREDAVASLEVIGRGGGGVVYKAELPRSYGKKIAIKKIILPKEAAAELTEKGRDLVNKKMRQIESEIRICGLIRHRNILNFLALVPRPDCYYLVYEYMENGSLQDVLNQASEGSSELDWLSRLRIAVGVAAGLEYLHMNYRPRIIHRDLKPANILLDDEMEARITDFGVSKALPDGHTHALTSKVAGTAGYIAPEYHQTLELTEKCDIYSFGVILGVLVMGKLPSDEFFQNTEEMSLVKWMRNVMASEDPSVAIDPNLMSNGFEEQMLLVLKIACLCTLDDPKERPTSKNVSIMLAQMRGYTK